MTNTLLIEIKNDKARNLLRDLEELNIIEVIKENIVSKKSMSERFKGFLNKEDGENLKNHIAKSRQEWDVI